MRILVATDGSRGGRAALRFAARIATRDRRTVLKVITIGIDGSAPLPRVSGEVRPKDEERHRAHRALDAATRALESLRVRADLRLVSARSGEPVPEAIAREADRWKADLVVVGSEGRDTLKEWVVGGVALRLIYVARRPVAVVRPPRRRRA